MNKKMFRPYTRVVKKYEFGSKVVIFKNRELQL